MRTLIFLAALIFAPAASAQTLENFHWLRGCWRTTGDGPVITEVWWAPPMPTLVGYAYTTRDGQLQGWEQTRIEIIDGAPHFVAMPNGAAAVRFRMLENLEDVIHTGREPDHFVAFENPEHDYPQTVVYMRFGNALTTQISGAHGAERITFNYRRISCSGSLRP